MAAFPPDEFQRILFFETARNKAAEAYSDSPEDAENLTRWGSALLELAHFQQGQESIKLVEDAVSKLEEARRLNPRRPETLWCLGNAYTSQGFLLAETQKANENFIKATECFQQALDVEPNNGLYRKAVEMSAKASAVHQQLQIQLSAQRAVFDSSLESTDGHFSKGQDKIKKNSDYKYDILGWVVLAVGVFVWIGSAKSPFQTLAN